MGVRIIAALLVPLHLVTSTPAIAALTLERAPVVSNAPSVFQPSAAELAAQPTGGIPHAPALPKFAPPSTELVFSAEPTDQELAQVRLFEEPLAPLPGDPPAGEDAALAGALRQYRLNPKDVAPLISFLAQYPQSRWRASLQLNLGLIYRSEGYWSKALTSLDAAWALLKNAPGRSLKALGDRAVGELAKMNGRLGHVARLEEIFSEISGRDVQGSGTEQIAAARAGLWLMKNEPGEAFRCGPFAIGRLFALTNPGHPLPAEIAELKSTAKGTSLAEIAVLAHKVGLDLQLAYRSPGAAIVTPSVVHWGVGHFAALSRKVGDAYLSQDPTFGFDTLVTADVLNAEASGYFLVPSGKLPAGWRTVATEEAKNIFGAGNIGPAGPPPPACVAVTTDPCQSCHGMAGYNFEMASVCLMLTDTPVGYAPPLGADMHFTANYNHRESAATTNVGNLGNKWGFSWLSYIQVSSTASTISFGPGGGQLTYTGYDSASGNFAPQLLSQDVLTKVSASNYVLTHRDGSKDLYSLSDGGASPRIFRTSSVDRSGNTVTYGYDANFRLQTVTDALGQTTVLSYELSTNPAATAFYHITKVTDPFGRYATFQYNSLDQLTSITDVLGLTSTFAYASGDFISSLTTPYGTTSFASNDTVTSGLTYDRWLQATDPLGGKERIEWTRDSSPVVNLNEPLNLVPSGYSNSFFQYRNTFYWDKKAMMTAPGDFSKARVTHWLHSSDADMSAFSSGTIESTKNPLENRVWRGYAGQSSSVMQGVSSLPNDVVRIMDDGTEQHFRYQYNALGNVIQTIDPLGRETDYVYDANLVDLLTIKQKNGSGYDILGSFTYNSQHLPLTATDASGQTATFTYNSAGQILTAANAKGETTTFAYDTHGYLQSITGPVIGANSAFTYDGFGRVQTATDSEGYTVTAAYDAFDRPTQVTYPDATNAQFLYNRLDLEWSKDRVGNWSRAMHDALRHVVVQQDPLQRRTLYRWCMCGALDSLIDPAGNKTSWTRDVQGRVTQKSYADGTSQSFTYEVTTSRLKSSTDAKGQTTNYQYFLDNALKQQSYANAQLATPAVSFTYDPVYPRIAAMTDGIGATNYTYNPITSTPTLGAARLASVAGPLANSTISYTYDELGRVLTNSVNGSANASSVAYDALGRATSMTNLLGTFGYAYVNQTGRLSSLSYPNGQVTNYSYYPNSVATPGNDDQRLQQIQNLGPGAVNISTHVYTYNADGQIQTWSKQIDTATAITSTFAYDAAHQLIRATQPSASAVVGYAYNYDAAGNRTQEQVGANLTAASYNNINQLANEGPGSNMAFMGTVNKPSLVTVGGNSASVDSANNWSGNASVIVGAATVPLVAVDGNGDTTNKTISVTVTGGASRTLGYDANGNLTDNGVGQTYQWDAANRLVKITQASGVTGFIYDGLGRRTQETLNGTVIKQWVWCGGAQSCEERDASNNVTKRFYTGLGEQIAGVNYFYATDHLGSVREMTDATGAIRARYDYDPYGRITKVSGDLEADFGFTGFYRHQASGLNLTLFRAYDAHLGRWLSRDPIGENGGINLYGYVMNNPINLFDPYGLDWLDNAANFSAGVGDNLSFGLTNWARGRLGINDGVNHCSGWYKGGEWTGIAIGIAAGGVLGAEAAEVNAGRKGFEFSHWIPGRMGGPRSVFNGNYVSEGFHYLTDPFRYPSGWQAFGPKLPAVAQQLLRVPWVYGGAAAGAAYGGASALANGRNCGCK